MLQAIASSPSDYHYAPTSEELEQIYRELADDLCQPPTNTPVDLRLTKSDSPDPVMVCGLLTYTLAITNTGPGTAYGILVTDTLPTELTYLTGHTGQPGRVCSLTGNVITCELNAMKRDDTASIFILTKVKQGTTAPSTIQNTAVVGSDNPDSDSSDNSDSEDTYVTQPPTLVIKKTVDKVEVVAGTGTNLKYTIAISNSGSQVAEGVVAVDFLPNEVNYVDHVVMPDPPGSSICTYTDRSHPTQPHRVTCDIGDLTGGSAITVEIDVSVPCTAAEGLITNMVQVDFDGEFCSPDNQSSVDTLIRREIDLKLTKTDNVTGTVKSGQMFTYTIMIENLGPSVASNIILTDTWPSQLGVPAPVPSGAGSCVFNNPVLTCTWPELPCGESVSVDIGFVVDPDDVVCDAEAINLAITTADERDTDPNNNDDDVEFMIHNPCADVGDAPDSTNHYLGVVMHAYPTAMPNVLAQFPTVFDPASGFPPGPKHQLDPNNPDAWLGPLVSREDDADAGEDRDGIKNINPPIDVPDHDAADDGVTPASVAIPACGATAFTYVVTVDGPQKTRYVNVWMDFNRDGDWNDTFLCGGGIGGSVTVREWAVRNDPSNLGPGTHNLSTPAFAAAGPVSSASPTWLRITLSDVPAPLAGDGRGPDNGYSSGETEDYLLK